MSRSKKKLVEEMELTCYIRRTDMKDIVNCSTCIYNDNLCPEYQTENGYKPVEGYNINTSRKYGRGLTLK